VTGYGLDGPGIESRWEARFSAPVQTDPGAHPASCTMGTRSLPEAKSGRGVTLTSHPFLVPWSRMSIAIPLLPLWAVRPVQSLSACTSVHFYQSRWSVSLWKHITLLVRRWYLPHWTGHSCPGITTWLTSLDPIGLTCSTVYSYLQQWCGGQHCLWKPRPCLSAQGLVWKYSWQVRQQNH